jgi:hypothetical protein
MTRMLLLLCCALVIAGCAESSRSETEPTFDEVRAIAEDELADSGCKFQVDDQSQDGLEDELLECLTKNQGQDKLYTIVHYTRHTGEDESGFAGFTTATRYFQNGNIKADPSGASEPGQPALDAERFSQAVKDKCSCGEVLTPEQ